MMIGLNYASISEASILMVMVAISESFASAAFSTSSVASNNGTASVRLSVFGN